MKSNNPLFLGIDIGTGGVRVMAVSENGHVAATQSVPFSADILTPQPGRHEQPPQAWWQAICRATNAAIEQLAQAGIGADRLAAVAVDGTSGTLVVLDRAGEPLRPALMYNDPRAAAEGDALNEAAGAFCDKLGYRFNASFALAKIAWLRNQEPAVFDQAARFVHQVDFAVEQLTDLPATTDYGNALKTGYDLIDECWPAWLDQHLGIASRLPPVVAPGTPIGTLSAKAAEQTGLPKGLAVVSGTTDGTAAFVASGARRPGDYNTTIGTTLVFKGISRQICRHPDGLIYCHKLPGGLWLPGAAGNVGADWIAALFPNAQVSSMDTAAVGRLPNDVLAYPLIRVGERFPFLAPAARGFFVPEPTDPIDRYAACLQGVAFIERLSYEVLDTAANHPLAVSHASSKPLAVSRAEVYSTGGGSRSDVWMQCRADATERTIHRPACGESAFGAAVLAATGTYYNNYTEAVERMVRIERSFTPDQLRTPIYGQSFERFRDELRNRGYL